MQRKKGISNSPNCVTKPNQSKWFGGEGLGFEIPFVGLPAGVLAGLLLVPSFEWYVCMYLPHPILGTPLVRGAFGGHLF